MKVLKKSRAKHSVRIRMYNVGFGDAFLLTFPGEDRDRKVLVDCGMHSAGPGPHKMSEIVRRIVADVKENGKSRIDVVVATHRHLDHVSGFKDPIWGSVEVGEVWLPWTEHPEGPEAKRIRDTQSKIARRLMVNALCLNGTERQKVLGLATNSYSNQVAMQTLHEGFAGNPKRRYLPESGAMKRFFLSGVLPGVKIHTLGPSRDPEVIRDMEPPSGAHYLRLGESEELENTVSLPLAANWKLSIDEFSSMYSSFLTTRDFKLIEESTKGDKMGIAAALEAAVNGTSLMLIFQIGRAFLLFPGDSQWGTWKSVIQDPEWVELLKRTTFYKIGHHGSHNATPVKFVENMLRDKSIAMVSTRHMGMWKHIPKPELLWALRDKSIAVIRSDKQDIADPKEVVRGLYNTDITVPI